MEEIKDNEVHTTYFCECVKAIEQTLDGQRLADFPKMQQLLDLWAELNSLYNLPEMTKFIGTKRKSPEEIAVLMFDYPRANTNIVRER